MSNDNELQKDDFKNLWLTGSTLETIYYDESGIVIATVSQIDIPDRPLSENYPTEDADFEILPPKEIEQ